ncbi:MAG: SDR family oxidoreductase [Bacteroidota bacterium]
MKTFLITGASKGIGRATAIQLVRHGGQRVIGMARDQEALASLAQELRSESGEFFALPFDLLSEDYAPLLSELRRFPKLDGLLNNAGLLKNKAFSELGDQDFQQLFAVNVFAPAKLCQRLENDFAPNAHIVNIGSMGGFQGSSKFPGLAAYSASKAAIASLSECLAEEWKEKKISVNCLALGAVQTEMLAQAFPGYQAPLSSEKMAEFMAWFLEHGHHFFNGKVLPVALNNP